MFIDVLFVPFEFQNGHLTDSGGAIMVGMASQRWWYKSDGSIVGFLDHEERWFYTTKGQIIGYIANGWIYSQEGRIIGYFDSKRKNVYDQQGRHLGFLEP